jgi:YebC/PmpR family DNA-binding regulatory protein
MAGHSKWANIRFRKSAQDAKRGKVFTRLLREVSVAAREGGADPDANPRLRTAIDRALSANVPKDTVERAIKRAAGETGLSGIEQIRYEGYAPGGVAVMVDCLTDNRNRTAADVRYAFTKAGGNLGTEGSVGYLFSHLGQISFPAGADEDRIMETALEAGAEDVVTNPDGSVDVLTSVNAFSVVREAMVSAGLEPEYAEITMRPSVSVAVESEDAAGVLQLFELLDELDDVQQVYSNADLPDELVEAQR